MVEDLVEWLERDLHRRVLAELEKLGKEERTPERLVEIVEKNRKTKGVRLKEGLDSIEGVLGDAGLAPDLIKKIRRRLESNSTIRSRLSR